MNCAKKISGIVLLLFTVSCGGPKIIPDKELARIFHDIYLTNAYANQYRVDLDSLNIYEPVFAAYGYTSEDIQYTIGNLAKRKSARLSDDVVEEANRMLREESRHIRRRVAIRDTIALIAREKFAEVVYFDSLIRVRRIADTARLRVAIDDIRPGSYEVSYSYFVDSLDRNPTLMTNAWLEDAQGRRTGGSPYRLGRGLRGEMLASLNAGVDHRRLVIFMNGYPEDLTTPSMRIDSLRVTYRLPAEAAVDRLSRSRYGFGILDSLYDHSFDSHEAHIVPPLIDTARTRIR